MIVDMCTVSMRTNKKGVISVRIPHGKFPTDGIGFFRCHFTRDKGLPQMICDDTVLGVKFPSRAVLVHPIVRLELCRSNGRIALISGNQISAFCFLRIFYIIDGVPKCPQQRSSAANMKRNDPCNSQFSPTLR